MPRGSHTEDRVETSALAPIERPRLVERLAATANYPIALLIAPAGYGKSVVLRQYLSSLIEPNVRFSLRAEHATLLGFLRGFAEALREPAPHAITALAGAYERSTGSPKRAADLARWMHAHVESFSGIVAIDDLHVADADLQIASFLTSLVERTKGKVRWIFASRSTTGLPVGTWLAYRDADLPIGEDDLKFTLQEATEAAGVLGLTISEQELRDLLALTEGWPAAMSFALRTSTRSSELRNVSALTREMIYRLLAEQVYAALSDDERALLEVAVALPVIDVCVLERAGFDRALPIVERLRDRTAFIYEEASGIYQCHELFREFLRHESALGGKLAQRSIHQRAAHALDAAGDVEHAIVSYIAASSPADVTRLLERNGFELLERAHGDVVARAIESLDEKTRRENTVVLALQGALQASAGKFARAESLFRRALSKAGSDRDLVAITSLRLASLIGNQGGDAYGVLAPIATDESVKAAYRAEALSLIAARQAISGELAIANCATAEIEALLPELESDEARVKVLHHLAIVSRHTGDMKRAHDALLYSSELASDLHLYNFMSRGYAVLSNLALQDDRVDEQLHYAAAAADAAEKAGDSFALQTALLQMLSARMRMADLNEALATEARLATMQIGVVASKYLSALRSVRMAWEGRFREAHSLLADCWRDLPSEVDRLSCGAQYALFLALDGDAAGSKNVLREVTQPLANIEVLGKFYVRLLVVSRAFCGIAEIANEHASEADRIIRRIAVSDEIGTLLVTVARSLLRARNPAGSGCWSQAMAAIEALERSGYGDVARLLRAVTVSLQRSDRSAETAGILTPSEREVLHLISEGLVPKEIATQTSRSIHTVRVHIANAIQKLECRGSAEAVRAAQRRGLL